MRMIWPAVFGVTGPAASEQDVANGPDAVLDRRPGLGREQLSENY